MPDLTKENKWRWIFSAYLFLLIPYMINNRFQYFPLRQLGLTPVDQAIPFMPWTGWIYTSIYFFPLLIAFALKDLRNLRNAILCAGIVSVVCNLFYFFLPTVYPRPDFTINSWTDFPMAFVHIVDNPYNCFPSAHVAFAFIACFSMEKENKFLGQLLLLAAILVSLSTLTTKQHYFWDVIAGYALARFAFRFTWNDSIQKIL